MHAVWWIDLALVKELNGIHTHTLTHTHRDLHDSPQEKEKSKQERMLQHLVCLPFSVSVEQVQRRDKEI